jgi:hypothetical protein
LPSTETNVLLQNAMGTQTDKILSLLREPVACRCLIDGELSGCLNRWHNLRVVILKKIVGSQPLGRAI